MCEQDYEQLTLFPGDFRASLFLQPGSDEARRMTVTSGRKCCELLESCDPIGSLAKMLLVSSAWHSTRCFLTWKASATPAKHLLFRLVPSTPRTDVTGVQSWPTPTAADAYIEALASKQQKAGSKHSLNLACAVRMYPTPLASDWNNRRGRKSNIQNVVGGKLNPTWVEWLMGFPTGWTDLNA